MSFYDFFTEPLKTKPDKLIEFHWEVTIVMLCIWIILSFYGYFSKGSIKYISIFIIAMSISQEFLDYFNRFSNPSYIDDLGIGPNIRDDLPIQLCHFGYWLSALTIFFQVKNIYPRLRQFIFNLSFFMGFSGALMGIITVSLEGNYSYADMLFLNLQLSIIIMNLLWLIFAYKMQFQFIGIIQSFISINILAGIVYIINFLINNYYLNLDLIEKGANYMFLNRPPEVNNFLVFSENHILGFEIIFFIYGFIIYLPFRLFQKKNEL